MIAVLDPRMPLSGELLTLAARRALRRGDVVILLDNGKVGQHAGLAGTLDAAAQGMSSVWGVTVERRTTDLLAADLMALELMAEDVARQHPAGVVISLCDWGITLPSIILASALEARSVPTAVISTDTARIQALATACLRIPGLPIVVMGSTRETGVSASTAEGKRLAPLIVDALTGSQEVLLDRFVSQDPARLARANKSGMLEVAGGDAGAGFTLLMEADHLGDGFPLVAPTPERVEAFLAASGYAAQEQIWPVIPPRPCPVTAEQVAVVGVMAGCRPQWSPVLYAAFRAMAAPEFRLFHAATTTHPSGTLVLVSGPDPQRFSLAASSGSLGPGFAANATLGRAVALSYRVLLGALPNGTDLSTQGSPAEYSYCCVENVAVSPWPGLHDDFGHPDAVTVTVLKSEGPHNVLDVLSTTPESLLGTFASTMATLGGNSSYASGGQVVVFMNPGHANLLASAGWTKRDVAEYLFHRARNRRSELLGRGIAPLWPDGFEGMELVPVARDATDVLVAVVGGPGPSSQIAIPWGYARGVTRTVDDP